MLKYGMVGGGPGSLIGDVHRTAIRIDDQATLVCGCFSRDIDKNKTIGNKLNIDNQRIYNNYLDMVKTEANKIDFVVVVTPNVSHYEICKAFLENGVNVVCDKPLTFTVSQSEELVRLKNKNNLLFGVAYTYSAYSAVKQMREMIKAGKLGKLRFINAEYPQSHLAKLMTVNTPWRLDPKISGPTACLGDIGTHIENLALTVTGLKIKRLSARLDTLVEGRILDDNDTVMVDYEGGARGLYWSSKIAYGNDNGVKIRVFGEKGSLEWTQNNPDTFIYTNSDNIKKIWARKTNTFYDEIQYTSPLSESHPEDINMAFANIYHAFIFALNKKKTGATLTKKDIDYPTVEMGLEGVKFIEKCLNSSKADSAWVNF